MRGSGAVFPVHRGPLLWVHRGGAWGGVWGGVSPAHLRATAEGVEEVEKHEAGEGHGGGAWSTGPVLWDLESGT